MLTHLRPALAMTLGMTVLTGLLWPLAMTGLAHAIAPGAANGSLIARGGQTIGSALIAQKFTAPGYLHSRPSSGDYVTVPSGASNYGPTSQQLADTVAGRRAAWQAENGGGAAPADAVTASGSGLDPDISAENALGQVARIAVARGVDPAQVRALVQAQVVQPWLGLYGAAHVNVLLANLALDAALPVAPAATN